MFVPFILTYIMNSILKCPFWSTYKGAMIWCKCFLFLLVRLPTFYSPQYDTCMQNHPFTPSECTVT